MQLRLMPRSGWSWSRAGTAAPACARPAPAPTPRTPSSPSAPASTGGKAVPDGVGSHPLVFTTLTAPSFGHVHGTRDGKACGAATRGPLHCPYGRPTTCRAVHDEDDPAVGQPICAQCYDYPSHVLWQYFAPELWRRFAGKLRRALAASLHVRESELGEYVTVQFAKVAQYQGRGVLHLHALIRLDGPKTDDGFADPPAWITAADLAAWITSAAQGVAYTAPPPVEGDPARVLRFGGQLDVRPVTGARGLDGRRLDEGELSAEQVAGYLAKYATKSAGDVPIESAHAKTLERHCGD